jgi:uncharacterized protein YbjT (DUF2867 family)
VEVLVTGATGFVGGALVPPLLAAGHHVRCLVRRPDALSAPWRAHVEVVAGSVEREQHVLRAADGVAVAYYLVHGMDAGLAGLVDRERAAAAAFREAAELAGVGRIVYLGGLVDEEDLPRVSEHLYARQQVGEELRAGPVPVTELRAGVVIGSGSASFELLLAAARAPVELVAPFTTTRTQPLALADLLAVLVAVLDDPDGGHRVVELGGPDVLTYGELVGVVRSVLGRRELARLVLAYLPPEAVALPAASAARLDPSLVLALLQSVRSDAVVRDPAGRERYADLLATPVGAAVLAALTGPGPRSAHP